MKSHYEGGELDRKETIAKLVADVENWDTERLIGYARECAERDLQSMTSDDLIDHWVSEMDSDEVPRFNYMTQEDDEQAPVFEINRTQHKRAS